MFLGEETLWPYIARDIVPLFIGLTSNCHASHSNNYKHYTHTFIHTVKPRGVQLYILLLAGSPNPPYTQHSLLPSCLFHFSNVRIYFWVRQFFSLDESRNDMSFHSFSLSGTRVRAREKREKCLWRPLTLKAENAVPSIKRISTVLLPLMPENGFCLYP